MKVTKKMIAEGWKQDTTTGEWIAPDKTGVRSTHYDANGKRERVLLVETHQEVGSDDRRGEDSPSGSTRKEVENAQLHAYQRVGLSRAEALRAVELGNGKARFNKG